MTRRRGTGSQCLLNRYGDGRWADIVADRDHHLIVGRSRRISGHHHIDLQHSGDQAGSGSRIDHLGRQTVDGNRNRKLSGVG